jgi:hypothetical protein
MAFNGGELPLVAIIVEQKLEINKEKFLISPTKHVFTNYS